MTNPGRMRDLSDVMELIKLRNLPESYAEELTLMFKASFASSGHKAAAAISSSCTILG